jgi:hypothetical protein
LWVGKDWEIQKIWKERLFCWGTKAESCFTICSMDFFHFGIRRETQREMKRTKKRLGTWLLFRSGQWIACIQKEKQVNSHTMSLGVHWLGFWDWNPYSKLGKYICHREIQLIYITKLLAHTFLDTFSSSTFCLWTFSESGMDANDKWIVVVCGSGRVEKYTSQETESIYLFIC